VVHLKKSLRCGLLAATLLAFASPATIFATQASGPSKAALDAGMSYLQELQDAALAYAGRDFDKALAKLDLAEKAHPNIPDTWDLRGAIYAEQHDFPKAQTAFEQAYKLSPRDFWPPYNLAQLLLMQKKYAEAAAAFQKLEVYKGQQELVQFKIIYSEVLEAKNDDAKTVLDAMKFPGDTPAYYFAHSAYGFATKNEKDGNYWYQAGLKVFGPDRCVSYYDALVNAGWVPARGSDGSIPQPAHMVTMPTSPLDGPGVQ
jgi:tetratricopeptide (TPR) repeat protein